MKSVKNIQKITKAMKMVAASKLRAIQAKAENSRGLWQPFTALLGDTPSMYTGIIFAVQVYKSYFGSCTFWVLFFKSNLTCIWLGHGISILSSITCKSLNSIINSFSLYLHSIDVHSFSCSCSTCSLSLTSLMDWLLLLPSPSSTGNWKLLLFLFIMCVL